VSEYLETQYFVERQLDFLTGEPVIRLRTYQGDVGRDQALGRKLGSDRSLRSFLDPPAYTTRTANEERYQEYLRALAGIGIGSMELSYRVKHGLEVKALVRSIGVVSPDNKVVPILGRDHGSGSKRFTRG
jgi:hypothetical protein